MVHDSKLQSNSLVIAKIPNSLASFFPTLNYRTKYTFLQNSPIKILIPLNSSKHLCNEAKKFPLQAIYFPKNSKFTLSTSINLMNWPMIENSILTSFPYQILANLLFSSFLKLQVLSNFKLTSCALVSTNPNLRDWARRHLHIFPYSMLLNPLCFLFNLSLTSELLEFITPRVLSYNNVHRTPLLPILSIFH